MTDEFKAYFTRNNTSQGELEEENDKTEWSEEDL